MYEEEKDAYIIFLKEENKDLKKVISIYQDIQVRLNCRISKLEKELSKNSKE